MKRRAYVRYRTTIRSNWSQRLAAYDQAEPESYDDDESYTQREPIYWITFLSYFPPDAITIRHGIGQHRPSSRRQPHRSNGH